MQWLITGDNKLTETLTDIKRKYKQPAMAAALINNQGIITRAAVGASVFGSDAPVNIDSRFHIGSTTKSMTALLIQLLVNEGRFSYFTTLEQVLPDIPMRDEYRDVTINELLLNKAGIIPFQRLDMEDQDVVQKFWKEIPAIYADPAEQRREAAKLALNRPPVFKPGTKAVYSNMGWAIAGHIIEMATGKPYEITLEDRIFKPLGMNNARIGGWPASTVEPDQPRGHFTVVNGEPKAQELCEPYTFPDWMNSSGGVHCSITDFALFARENLAGLEGHGKLMPMESYNEIHTVHLTAKIKDMYPWMEQDSDVTMGYGWGVFPVEGGNLSCANGSGGTFYAIIAVYPPLDAGFAGFTNCGDGSPAINEAIKMMTGLDVQL